MHSGSEKNRRFYSAEISKGAGLVDETRRLVQEWRPGESLDALTDRVQQRDILGNATSYRTRDIVRRVFAPRYLRPSEKPARILRALDSEGLPLRVFREMVLLFAARKDPLVYDFTCKEYWRWAKSGRVDIDTNLFLSFLSEAIVDGKLEKPWPEQVSIKVGRGVLGILRDVGFIREVSRFKREVIRHELSSEGAAILARDLCEGGIGDSSIADHPDWALFGLSPEQVLDKLDNVGENRGLLLQRAGTVVGFTWTITDIEELIHVLAG